MSRFLSDQESAFWQSVYVAAIPSVAGQDSRDMFRSEYRAKVRDALVLLADDAVLQLRLRKAPSHDEVDKFLEPVAPASQANLSEWRIAVFQKLERIASLTAQVTNIDDLDDALLDLENSEPLPKPINPKLHKLKTKKRKS